MKHLNKWVALDGGRWDKMERLNYGRSSRQLLLWANHTLGRRWQIYIHTHSQCEVIKKIYETEFDVEMYLGL